ncbi:MAG: hypothetical protein ACXV8Q_19595 [Methylobacter sp.]
MTTQHIEQNEQPKALPHIEPLSVDYYAVVIDVQYPTYKLMGKPVSPYFHTREEAHAFRDKHKIDGAYCIAGDWSASNEEEAEQLRRELFASDKPQLAALYRSTFQRAQEEIAAIVAERALA